MVQLSYSCPNSKPTEGGIFHILRIKGDPTVRKAGDFQAQCWLHAVLLPTCVNFFPQIWDRKPRSRDQQIEQVYKIWGRSYDSFCICSSSSASGGPNGLSPHHNPNKVDSLPSERCAAGAFSPFAQTLKIVKLNITLQYCTPFSRVTSQFQLIGLFESGMADLVFSEWTLVQDKSTTFSLNLDREIKEIGRGQMFLFRECSYQRGCQFTPVQDSRGGGVFHWGRDTSTGGLMNSGASSCPPLKSTNKKQSTHWTLHHWTQITSAKTCLTLQLSPSHRGREYFFEHCGHYLSSTDFSRATRHFGHGCL